MTPRNQMTTTSKRLTGNIVRHIKSTLFCTLFLSQLVFQHDQCLASPQSTHATSAASDKLGAYMLRQPESTIAPLYDEVLFECGLNLTPDRLEWRFRPQYTSRTASYHISNNDNINDFIYLSENVSWIHPRECWPIFTIFFFFAVSGKLEYNHRRRYIKAACVREPAIGGRVSMRSVVWCGRIGVRPSETFARRYQSEWCPRWRRRLSIDTDGSQSSHSAVTNGALESVAGQQHPDSLRRSCIESTASVEFLQVTFPPALECHSTLFKLPSFFALQRQLSPVKFETPTTKRRSNSAIGDASWCWHILVLRNELNNCGRSENATEIRD